MLFIPETQRRIIVIGKVGAGKSATEKAILGKWSFESRQSFISVTKECTYAANLRNGIRYEVYDTPGSRELYSSHKKDSDLEHLKQCLIVTSPGFHAIVYVISAAQRIEEGDTRAIAKFEDLLGKDLYEYAIVVFTHVKPENLKDIVNESPEISEFCRKCNNRYLSFGTDGTNVNSSLVDAFDNILDGLVDSNAISPYYRHSAYLEAFNLISLDAQDLYRKNKTLSLEEAIQIARQNALRGESSRDYAYLSLARDLNCCTLL